MSTTISLQEVNNKVFQFKGRSVVPSSSYAVFCGKDVKVVNQAIQRLNTKGRLAPARDYYKVTGNMVTSCDHELQNCIDPRFGAYLLTRKAVNTLSHYFDDINSVTLSNEVNTLSATEQTRRDRKDPIIASLQEIIAIREDQIAMQEQQEENTRKIALLENKVKEFDGDTGYRSVIAFSRGIGVPIPLNIAQQVGRNCTRLCRERGLSSGKVPDERYGSIKSYPVEVLNDVFGDMNLFDEEVEESAS